MNKIFNEYMQLSLEELEQTFIHLMNEEDLFWAFIVFIEYAQKQEFISDEVLLVYTAIMTKNTIITLDRKINEKIH